MLVRPGRANDRRGAPVPIEVRAAAVASGISPRVAPDSRPSFVTCGRGGMMFTSDRAKPIQGPRGFGEKTDFASPQHNRLLALRNFQVEEHLDRLVIPARLPPRHRRLQRKPWLKPPGGIRDNAQPLEADRGGDSGPPVGALGT